VAGRGPSRDEGRDLNRAIAALEASVEPLFAAGRYRDFFQRAHDLRARFRDARLSRDERDDLWARLNRCTEAAKERQTREFAARTAANLARWREQVATAEAYAAALVAEIDELRGRGGRALDRDRWQRRIAEKQARLRDVEANIHGLRSKIEDVVRRPPERPGRGPDG
jgi:chromosome segregation ATPase